MDKEPLVSVTISCYNQEPYIAEALDSVLKQRTSFDFEIVCGDDGSTDGSRRILEDYERRFPGKVRVLYHPKNLGLVLNTKSMLDSCRGKYIATLDGDDTFLNDDKLQKNVDFLESHPDHGFVYSDAKILFEESAGKYRWEESAARFFKRPPKTGFVYEDYLLNPFINASTVMFRRDLYRSSVDLAYYHSIGFRAQDAPLYLELARVTKFGYLNEPMAVYRVFSNTVSRPESRDKLYAHIDAGLKGALHFIRKYPPSERTARIFYRQYHYFQLTYAMDLAEPERAKEAISYLSKHGQAGSLAYLYAWGSRFAPARILAKLLRRVFKLQLDFWAKA